MRHVRYCALVRRKLALLLGMLALFAVAGGAIGATIAFGDSDQPAQRADRSAAAAQENRGERQRGDRAGRPPDAGDSSGSARPLLAVVGASFSAGVGAGHPGDAWPEDLARMMHWRLEVSADPGAGYVGPGARHRGPFSRLAGRLHLARTQPQTIIIQGGHDDIGRPLPLIRQQVESLIATIRRGAPRARLAILTVFPRGGAPAGPAWATDQAIVAAARHADPAVVVFDPLAGHWYFRRIGDHLHPTPAGHQWIAERLAAGLRSHQLAT
jgi:acyl-CoA thioesterase I